MRRKERRKEEKIYKNRSGRRIVCLLRPTGGVPRGGGQQEFLAFRIFRRRSALWADLGNFTTAASRRHSTRFTEGGFVSLRQLLL